MLKMLFVFVLLLCNLKLAYSCFGMRGGGGGDIPITTTLAPLRCSTCNQIPVITGGGVGVDEPITQVVTTGADGCRNVAVTCTSATPGTEVVFFYSNNGMDLGTSTGATTLTRDLVCNANGELQLTENGQTREVDQISCLSAGAGPVCSTCANPTVITGTGSGTDQPITFTRGTDANGCATVTATCTTATVGAEIFLFYDTNQNSQGTTTISRTFVCDANAQLILTENGAMAAIRTVECITA